MEHTGVTESPLTTHAGNTEANRLSKPTSAPLLLAVLPWRHKIIYYHLVAQIEKEALYGLRMYGLLLEACYYYIRTIFGDEILNEIKAKANVNYSGFSTYKVSLRFWIWV